LESEEVIIDESKVFFFGNATGPPRPDAVYNPPEIPYRYNAALRLSVQVVIGLTTACVLLLGIYTYLNRAKKIMKASSPVFLSYILFGAIISFAGIIILSISPIVRCGYFFKKLILNLFYT
jgi:hypothetical protein